MTLEWPTETQGLANAPQAVVSIIGQAGSMVTCQALQQQGITGTSCGNIHNELQ